MKRSFIVLQKILPNISKIYVIGKKNNVDEEDIKSLKVPVQKFMDITLKILPLTLLSFMIEKKVLGGIAIEVEMIAITILYYALRKNH